MTENTKGCDCQHCAENCPFLEINYFEAIQKIPYHCDLFDTFLAFDGQVLRCSECLGQQRSIKEEGLNFINAYHGTGVNRSVTKVGFARLLPALQNQFVSFLKKFGHPVGIPSWMDINTEQVQGALIAQLTQSMQEVKQEPKEAEEFKLLLKKQGDDFPEVLDSKICKFLINLFGALDVSERDMLMQILRNKHTLAQFLQKLKFMPKDKSLLGSIRVELRLLLPQAQIENASIVPTIPAEKLLEPKTKS